MAEHTARTVLEHKTTLDEDSDSHHSLMRYFSSLGNYVVRNNNNDVQAKLQRERLVFRDGSDLDITIRKPGVSKGRKRVYASVSASKASMAIQPSISRSPGVIDCFQDGLAVHSITQDHQEWARIAITDRSVIAEDFSFTADMGNDFPGLCALIRWSHRTGLRVDGRSLDVTYSDSFNQMTDQVGIDTDTAIARILVIPEHLLMMGMGVSAAMDGTVTKEYLPGLE